LTINQFLPNRVAPGLVAVTSSGPSLIAAEVTVNAAKALIANSGGAWLRPTAITGPRMLRIGARVGWQ
jgi:hypothetical protein